MKLNLLALATLAIAIVVAVPSRASAQYGGFYMGRSDNPNGPTVSPYLNLLQSNNAGVTNYQSLVKPLIDQSGAIRSQGRRDQPGAAATLLGRERCGVTVGARVALHVLLAFLSEHAVVRCRPSRRFAEPSVAALLIECGPN